MDRIKLVELEKEILLKKEDPKGIFLIKSFRKANRALRAFIAKNLKVETDQLQNEQIKNFIADNRKDNKELKALIIERKDNYKAKQEYLQSQLNQII